jgi:hypothetical protein
MREFTISKEKAKELAGSLFDRIITDIKANQSEQAKAEENNKERRETI